MVGKDEEGAAVGAAEDDVDRALGNVDLGDLLARRIVDDDLAVGDVDVAFAIDGDALAAAVDEGFEVFERAVGANYCAVGAIFGCARNVDALAWMGGDESVGVEVVREAPA